MAPSVFARVSNQSAVVHQPQDPQERHASMQALLSCPTWHPCQHGTVLKPSSGCRYSIHVKKTQKGEVRAVQESFPIPVPNCDGVYFCGFTDEKAYAASAYLILSPRGNVLVDSPRFNPVLVKGFDALGGVGIIFLTHKCDCAPLFGRSLCEVLH